MEEKIAELTAKIAELEASSQVTNTMFAETYYYLTIPLMVLIPAGFLAYEMGATRVKNVLSSGVKNILAFAFLIFQKIIGNGWLLCLPLGLNGNSKIGIGKVQQKSLQIVPVFILSMSKSQLIRK